MLTLHRVFGLALTLAGVSLGLSSSLWAQTPAPAATSRKTNDTHAEAVELLRRVIQEQQKSPGRIVRTPPTTSHTPNNPAAQASRTELERQFLEGKITAKQFQRALEVLEKNPPPSPAAAPSATTPPPAAVSEKTAKERSHSPRAASALPGKVITNQPAATTPTQAAEDAPEQKALSDVEAKIDEILARREAQIQAAKTNSAANAQPAGPLTKREKLNALLSQLIQGKITDAEYKTQREKVMAEPD
jgi:hypothetical protein